MRPSMFCRPWFWIAAWLLGALLGGSLFDRTWADNPEAEPSAAAFQEAQPVWPAGREKEINLTVGFRTVFQKPQADKVELRLTCSTIYRAWLNGQFLGHGPARGPKGFFRIDQWNLTDRLQEGENLLVIETVGYNANSFYVLDQPSFLQAEIVADGQVVSATRSTESQKVAVRQTGKTFEARPWKHRVQKVQRYSFQRAFVEIYRLNPETERLVHDLKVPFEPLELAEVQSGVLLKRGVAYPDFQVRKPTAVVARGRMELNRPKEKWPVDSLVKIISPKVRGYAEADLEAIPTSELLAMQVSQFEKQDKPYQPDEPISLTQGEFEIVDMGLNTTGFIGAEVTCTEPSRFWIVFDEITDDQGDVHLRRMGCSNLISFTLQPGTYRLESIEPYTGRYWKFICPEGSCQIKGVFLREMAHPAITRARFESSDPRLNRLFEAGVETYRQNSIDMFMDCPSRERAGWLCDSFFTARVERDLTGDSRIERIFFENYLLPERFDHLPDGMLPMCHPSDHDTGVFIPNWAMWFVVELAEYQARSGDRAMVGALEEKVAKLFDYFKKFENEDGLLEKLEGWVFVEWSEANRFVQDVNYPTNMLYAGALSAAGQMFDRPKWQTKAEAIRQTIRQQSFDGQFFVDNGLRKDGRLEITKNRSEVCQYFAFFFDVANPTTHGQLWQTLRDDFGPDRQKTKKFAEVHQANSFIGNMLRIELLSRYGQKQQILDESIGYLLHMADRTGTLWENMDPNQGYSCCHGFASHICHTLYRDVLGIKQVDQVGRKVVIAFGDVKLDRCEGTIPTADGKVTLRWRREGDTLVYQLSVPDGYEVEIAEPSKGLKLKREEKP